MFSVLILTLLVSVILNQNIKVVNATAKPRLYIAPVVSIAEVGDIFSVDIKIDDVEFLYAWQANVTFNPAVLDFVNVTGGEFLSSQPEGAFGASRIEEGWAFIGWSTIGEYVGKSGSGTLATIEFRVLADGESSIKFRIEPIEPIGVYPTQLVLQMSSVSPPYWKDLYPPEDFTTQDSHFSSLDTYYQLLDSYNQLLENFSTLLDNYTALLANHNTLNSTYQTLLVGYQDLQSQYENLNSTYNSLMSDYDDLGSKHDALTSELSTARNLSYVLGITTVAFAATTVYFVSKRPKVKA